MRLFPKQTYEKQERALQLLTGIIYSAKDACSNLAEEKSQWTWWQVARKYIKLINITKNLGINLSMSKKRGGEGRPERVRFDIRMSAGSEVRYFKDSNWLMCPTEWWQSGTQSRIIFQYQVSLEFYEYSFSLKSSILILFRQKYISQIYYSRITFQSPMSSICFFNTVLIYWYFTIFTESLVRAA